MLYFANADKTSSININSDNYWDKLIPFLTSHDFDVIHMQEVTGKNTIIGNLNSKLDCYVELQQILAANYKGELAINQRYLSDPAHAYLTNATFYKKHFVLLKRKEIILHSNPKMFPHDVRSYEDVGWIALHIKIKLGDKQISFINAHLAWAPTPKEEPHQTKQAQILLNFLQTVPHHFILSGDFNLDPKQPTIQKLNAIARNLIKENNITNTLNPRTHRAKILFPQGIAVDYIFVTNNIVVKDFSVVENDFSDHFGLQATIEV
jgi:endonuclease/exonuclease/phosphatase family metal-dependent hydrolase